MRDRSNADEINSGDDKKTDKPDGFTKTRPQRSVFQCAPNAGKFMSNKAAFDALYNTENLVDRIPLGPKDDVYLVLDNQRNSSKKRAEFPDDCGSWCSDKGTSANMSFILTEQNEMVTVFKRDGIFCKRRNLKGSVVYEPYEPQPTRFITFHRYYTALKDDNDYKRRVTTIVDAPDDLRHLTSRALVEYSGVKVGKNRPHGNAKYSTGGYTRTDPAVLAECAAQSQKPGGEICYNLAKDNSILGPQTSRQVRDKIYREKKKAKPKVASNNIADEIIEIIGKLRDNTSVRYMGLRDNLELPTIILYSDEQMLDFIANCTGDGSSVVGIDRTFNLGKCFVTPMTYKNQGVVHHTTKENPIMLGPLFLHWDGKEKTYREFFNHIRDMTGKQKMTIGTDEEKAMTAALQDIFHDATFLLCSKHVEDNLRRILEKSGTPLKERNHIRNIIFGEDGIVYSKTDVQYNTRVDDLVTYLEQYPRFKSYWENTLEPKLKKFIVQPLQKKEISHIWTNNNAESVNNRLKQVADWKVHKLPELVEKLSLVSEMQILDLRRALHGTGNFKLTCNTRSFFIEPYIWQDKSPTEKRNYFRRFLATKKRNSTGNLVQASHAKFVCQRPKQSCGKKPGQRKRCKLAKTLSIKKQ